MHGSRTEPAWLRVTRYKVLTARVTLRYTLRNVELNVTLVTAVVPRTPLRVLAPVRLGLLPMDLVKPL